MSSLNRDYNYYQKILESETLPLAFVDLDLLEANLSDLKKRAGNKQIRIASKSVRIFEVIKKALDFDPIYQGIMCFSNAEAVWLSQKGMDDLLVGYPGLQEEYVRAVCGELKKGKKIYLMIDLPEHIEYFNKIGKEEGVQIPLCIDVDMSSVYPGLRFGVWRSSVNDQSGVENLLSMLDKNPNVAIKGLMGYEAAIAGMGDNFKGKLAQNLIVRFLKNRSAKEIAERRGNCVKALKDFGCQLDFVNGGGTGSMEWTRAEDAVTEITVGSGLFNSTLFDNYSNFKHHPAAAYAMEIVRKPGKDIFTAHGGGYTASGAIGKDKEAQIYLPKEAALIPQEGAGEVQTPFKYSGNLQLKLGQPVFMRHSKAGELFERFKEVALIKDGKIIGKILSYRGEGQCFV
ncbi:MAG: amino acid deaminase/aldolase [Chitinophagales bacterium]